RRAHRRPHGHLPALSPEVERRQAHRPARGQPEPARGRGDLHGRGAGPQARMKAVVTDIDGTLTDRRRRISTAAIEEIRRLVDGGIPVVLASGNTLCFMDGIAKMIGTDGTVICENGGVWRKSFLGEPVVAGDRRITLTAFQVLRDHYASQGIALDPFSHGLRFADVAFARS